MKGSEPIFIDKKSKVGVLMIHGFSSTPNEFKELSVYLAEKGLTNYAPLIAGHGTSPEHLLKTNSDEFLKSVKKAYLELQDKSEKIFIIGNSFGANLSFWLVKEFNNKPTGLISLGAPIFLRNHLFVILRLYSYGLFKEYYRKPPRLYKTDYLDMADEITYAKIPTKSLREFLSFVRRETKPNLGKIKIPVLVAHASIDPVIHPKSATFIYEHLGSSFKKIYWFSSNFHNLAITDRRSEIFQKIYDFIKEVINNNK
ncbi:MAG: alpha/beta fold hydrolase [Patescibacteria group bacterium]